MSSRSLFITGTGTDIGKTLVCAGIARQAVLAGIRTAVVKPVQTGIADYPADVEVVNRLAEGLISLPRHIARPFEFAMAASPHLAAGLEKRELTLSALVAACRRAEAEPEPELVIFEGAGGLYVPLNRHETMLELIREIGCPAVLTASVGLGTINHTMLSVEAMRRAGIEIAGIVFSGMPAEPDVIAGDNVETVAAMSGVPVLAVIPFIAGDISPRNLEQAFAQPTLVRWLKEYLADSGK